MKHLKILLLLLLFMLGAQVVKGAETTLLNLNLSDLKTLSVARVSSTVGGMDSVRINATNKAVGLLYNSSSESSASTVDPSVASGNRCQQTSRILIQRSKSYFELLPLLNPASISFTSGSNNAIVGEFVVWKKVVGASTWDSVCSLVPTQTGSTSTICATPNINISTAGNVSIRIENRLTSGSLVLWGNITVTGMDMTAPELEAVNPLTPIGNNVALNTSVLTAKFNRAIDKGTGNVTLYKAGGTLVKTIDITTAAASVVGDSTLSVSVSDVTFDPSTQYYVLMDNGAVKGKNAVVFAGISSNTDWTFTTKGSASSDKDILTFTVLNQDSSKISGSNVSVWVKYKSDVTKLKVSTLTTSPAAQVTAPIGWSTNMEVNFTSPVTFTIEAEDQTTQSYTVTVYVNANADATIKSMALSHGVAKVSVDEVSIRTMAVDQQNIASLTINGAEDATILFRGNTYPDTATLTSIDITGSPTITITAADGANKQNYTLVAADADTAKLPLLVKGGAASPARWADVVVAKGWLMDAAWHSSLYAAASSRNPIRFMTSGDYIMLHCDSAPEKVSYYLRANSLTTYKVLLLESVNGVTWDTAKIATSDVPTADFGKIESPLKQTSRFIKWIFTDLTGSGQMMFDEVAVSKYIPGVLSAEKDILSFSLLAANGKTYPGVVDKTSSKVTIMAPSGVSLVGAKANFGISLKAVATVGGVTQVSGTTENDFTSGLTYRITAENGTFTSWTVEISRLAAPSQGLLQFDFSTGSAKTENFVVAESEVKKIEISAIATQAEFQSCGKRVQIAINNSITFPILSNMGYLEGGKWGVGTNGQKFVIEKKYESGAEWLAVDTITTNVGCNTANLVHINAHAPAQLRIRAYVSGTSIYGVFTIHEADMVPPTLAASNALLPAPGTTNLTSRPGKLEMTFSETVKAGTGSIGIYKVAGDVLDTAFDIKGAGVQFNGNKLTINFTKKLALNTAYYVSVPAGVILDAGENSFAGITNKTTWTFTTKTSESSDASIFGVALTTPTGTTSVSYGAPVAGTPAAGVTPLAQRVIYKTDPTQLKIAGFTLPSGAVVTSPTDWSTQTYNLVATPLEITVAAEDNTQSKYSLYVSQVVGNHLANISSIRGDYAYARANLSDTTVVVKTVGYNSSYNISNVLIVLADSAKITVASKDSVNRVSMPSLNLTTPQSLKVVSHNGDSTKYWKVSARDIGKAAVPVHFEGSYADLSRVLALTDEPGWLPYNMMNEYEQSGNRRPSKMNMPGSYVLLALDKVGDSVSYKSRVGADNGYDFELRESADAVTWTSLIRHNKDHNQLVGGTISATNLPTFKARLNPSTRYLQWYVHSVGTDGTTTQVRLDDVRVTERTTLSNEKKITGFSINGVNGTLVEALKQIGVELPAGTDVTALIPTIDISYFATVNPASGVARDFTNSVKYMVTAENGTTQEYTVTVLVDPLPITGVAKNNNAEFTLYPNPVGSTLYINAEYEVASVAIYNQLGTLVYAATQNIPSVDLSAIPAGAYYVQVKFANGKTGVRLINKQ